MKLPFKAKDLENCRSPSFCGHSDFSDEALSQQKRHQSRRFSVGKFIHDKDKAGESRAYSSSSTSYRGRLDNDADRMGGYLGLYRPDEWPSCFSPQAASRGRGRAGRGRQQQQQKKKQQQQQQSLHLLLPRFSVSDGDLAGGDTSSLNRGMADVISDRCGDEGNGGGSNSNLMMKNGSPHNKRDMRTVNGSVSGTVGTKGLVDDMLEGDTAVRFILQPFQFFENRSSSPQPTALSVFDLAAFESASATPSRKSVFPVPNVASQTFAQSTPLAEERHSPSMAAIAAPVATVKGGNEESSLILTSRSNSTATMTSSETVCVSIAGEVAAVSPGVPTKEKTAASSSARVTNEWPIVAPQEARMSKRMEVLVSNDSITPTANTNECRPPSCLLVAISVAAAAGAKNSSSSTIMGVAPTTNTSLNSPKNPSAARVEPSAQPTNKADGELESTSVAAAVCNNSTAIMPPSAPPRKGLMHGDENRRSGKRDLSSCDDEYFKEPASLPNLFLRTSADVRIFELKDLIISRLGLLNGLRGGADYTYCAAKRGADGPFSPEGNNANAKDVDDKDEEDIEDEYVIGDKDNVDDFGKERQNCDNATQSGVTDEGLDDGLGVCDGSAAIGCALELSALQRRVPYRRPPRQQRKRQKTLKVLSLQQAEARYQLRNERHRLLQTAVHKEESGAGSEGTGGKEAQSMDYGVATSFVGLEVVVFSGGQTVVLDDRLTLRDVCQYFWDEKKHLVLYYRTPS